MMIAFYDTVATKVITKTWLSNIQQLPPEQELNQMKKKYCEKYYQFGAFNLANIKAIPVFDRNDAKLISLGRDFSVHPPDENGKEYTLSGSLSTREQTIKDRQDERNLMGSYVRLFTLNQTKLMMENDGRDLTRINNEISELLQIIESIDGLGTQGQITISPPPPPPA